MSIKPYSIEIIQPEWALEPEDMGSKKKFWYKRPSKGHQPNRLFKYPHPGTGEHWAEKIAAEIGKVCGISCARVTLAECDGERGSSSWSFMLKREELFHGNQLLAGTLDRYDKALNFRQSDHTVENIFKALDLKFRTPDGSAVAKQTMADYLVFDAIIGNTDRHHENWGLVLWTQTGEWFGQVAHSFDHATSLGREWHEIGQEKCKRFIDGGNIGAYSEKARGAVYWSNTDKHAPSPLQPIRNVSDVYPEFFKNSLARLTNINADKLEMCVKRVPDDWMSSLSKTFAIELLRYNLSELGKLLK